MFRSFENLSTAELINLLRKSFILGFSIGAIGILCLLLSAFRKENILIVGAAALIPLLLVLFMNNIYGRISSELTRRVGE
jgi:hypothetical protein